MKKIIYAVLATLSGLVLLFSYRTSLEAVQPTVVEPASTGSTSGQTSSGTASGSTTGSSTSGSSSTQSSGTSSSATTTSSLTDGTYTGDSANTRYGPVQVQITVSQGAISDVTVVDYPDSNGRDRAINQSALPRLVSETIAAQSAEIDMVSGATYTSDGYLTSLQSAIDQAQS
ncbi:FMN-binding protein [Microbacterium sp.]|uniref:FMN-binding protein n=1 Tax=Microbacterium sp. TaxID=51671 RepID=UPI003F707645